MKYLILIGIAASCFSVSADASDNLLKNLVTQVKTNSLGKQSQQRVSELATETRSLLDEYRLTLRKIENTKTYNNQLKKIITSQKSELNEIKAKLTRLKETHRDVVPLMLRMIAMLEKFVRADIPFLAEERANRVQLLKDQMDEAKYSTSEKYRRILEAFQVEAEYGRTMETYQDILTGDDGKVKTVNYLRMGRITWLYQTLDGKESGMWSPKDRGWHPLAGEFRKPVREGILMAKKQKAPNLLHLPILMPETIL